MFKNVATAIERKLVAYEKHYNVFVGKVSRFSILSHLTIA